MGFLARLGFRAGSDEMYLHISGLAVRLSWLVLIVLLLGWSVYDRATNGGLTGPVPGAVCGAGRLLGSLSLRAAQPDRRP